MFQAIVFRSAVVSVCVVSSFTGIWPSIRRFTQRGLLTRLSSAVRLRRNRVWTTETMDAKLLHYQVCPIG